MSFIKETKNEKKPCPVCESIEFKERYEHNGVCGPGYFAWITSIECKNCGVLLSPDRNKEQ